MDTAADFERSTATDGAACPGAEGSANAPAPVSGTSRGGRDAATPPAVAGPDTPARKASAPAGLVFDDPFDRTSSDDTDRGWGDLPTGSADDDFTRFLNEKPPHHL
jgi:hypothetical protein